MDKSGPRRATPPRPSQPSASVLDSWCPPAKSRTVEKKYKTCPRLTHLPEKWIFKFPIIRTSARELPMGNPGPSDFESIGYFEKCRSDFDGIGLSKLPRCP